MAKLGNHFERYTADFTPRSARADYRDILTAAASILLSCMSATMPRQVCAQAANTDSPTTGLKEVVVTAERRSENMQHVPVSITAFSASQLQDQQITSPVDLSAVVSNLAINLPNGSQQPIYSIRGINTADYSIGQDGPVAIYYDEVYVGNVALQGVNLFDLSRVEVLKGPQGTLYGKNTTGGAVNFISRVPDLTTEGDVTVSYGNYNQLHTEGGMQTALSDTVAVRVAFTTDRADGWLKNTAPGAPNLSSTDDFGLRATLLYKPSDKLRFILRASTSRSTPLIPGGGWASTLPSGLVGQPSYPAAGANGVLLEPEVEPSRTSYTPSPRNDDGLTNAVSLTADAQLSDDLTLTSITAWNHGSLSLPFDGFTHIDILTNDFYGTTTQVSQDLRLTGQYSGPFQFILGAYANREYVRAGSLTTFLGDIDVNRDGVINAADCIAGGYFAACSSYNKFEQIKKTAAAYTDESYVLSKHFTLHAGLRYTRDEGNLPDYTADIDDVHGNFIANTIPGTAGASTSLQFASNNVSGRFGIDYNLNDDVMFYASYNRGYRGASFNNQAFYSPAELDVAPPETVSSYEVGFKAQGFSHRVRLNGAVFDMEYKNQQVLTYNPVTSANNLVSLGASRVRGGELDLNMLVATGLRLSASVGIVDGKVLQGVANGANVSGNNLQNAPNTASVGIDWSGTLGQRVLADLNIDGAYTGKQYFDLNNFPQTTEGGYCVVNGHLRFSNASDKFGVSLWAKNIMNRHFYWNMSLTNFVSADYVVLNAPRMYGISFDERF